MSVRKLVQAFVPLLLPAALFLWWWFASRDSDSPYFPPLSVSLQAFAQLLEPESLSRVVVPTAVKFLAGYALGSLLGVAIGLWFGYSVRARQTFMPLTEFARATPVAALVPLVMLVLGPTAGMEILLVMLATLWPTLLNTVDGVLAVEPLHGDVSKVHGFSGSQQLRWVILPSALPQIMAGLRIGLALGLQVVIIAGMLAGTSGLGSFALYAQTSYDIPEMWAGIFALALIGVITSFLFIAIERRLLVWHRGWRAQERGGSI